MKQRVLSLALALMLCLSLLPMGALAAEDAADVIEMAEEAAEEVTAVEETGTLLSGDVAIGLAIDEENFPDDTFRGYLKLNYDEDNNGYFSEEEIAGIYSIRINGRGEALTSLKGIEHFTELILLEFYNGRVKELDVSNNKKLESLNCNNNLLTKLDVSNNPELTELSCNNNQLTALDVSNNPKLTLLSCNGNSIPSLNLVNNEWLLRAINQGEKTDVDDYFHYYYYYADYSNDLYINVNLNVPKTTEVSTEAGAGGSGPATNDVAVDETNFPDPAFRTYIAENFDHDENGVLSYDEITKVTSLYMNNMGISNLTGIEYLTAVTAIRCADNNLTSLDVSALTALEELYCSDNQLTSLNVSANTKLEALSCMSNRLTALDVSNNTALKDLSCAYNQIEELDVTNLTELEELSFGYNEVSSIDLSNNTKLWYIFCEGCNLTELDLSAIEDLADLSCGHNQLTELDVSRFENLNWLGCSNNRLTELDVSNNTELEALYCGNNLLTELDIRNNTKLIWFGCAGNLFDRVDISNSPELCDLMKTFEDELDFIAEEDANGEMYARVVYYDGRTVDVTAGMVLITDEGEITVPMPEPGWNEGGESGDEPGDGGDVEDTTAIVVAIDYKSFPDEAFRGYIAEELDRNGDGSLSEKEILETNELWVSSMGITDLTGIEYFTELEHLDCGWNELTELDVSANTKLLNLDFYENQIEEIDLSANTKLETFSCGYNALTELDVTMCPNLRSLYCSGNAITELDISKNSELMSLYVMETELTELDLEGHEGLGSLDISFTPGLADLDTSMLTELSYLACCGLGLTEIDLSAYPNMRDLDCAYNSITELNLGLVPNLEMLSCSNNALTSLNLSAVPYLSSLSCYGNDIKALNIAGNEMLYLCYAEGTCEEWVDGVLLYQFEADYFWADMLVDETTRFILEIVPGDADGDGEVFVDDLVVLMKSILKVDGTEVSPEVGDLNGDETVDILDVIRLVRELAKMYPATG